MSGRKYSLQEIDEMRAAIKRRLPQPFYEAVCPTGGGWSKQTEQSIASYRAFDAHAEDELRTALLAGLGPEDFPAEKPEAA